MYKKILLTLIIPLLACRLVFAQTLDPSFVTGTGFNGNVAAITQSPDGRIYIGGSFTQYNGWAVSRIARLNNDGTADSSFTGTADNAVTSICLLQDGRVLVGGAFNLFNGQARNKLVCIFADGAIDTSFHYSLGILGGTSPSYYNVQAITQQPDGKIIVAGEFTQYDLNPAGHIVRLNTDGTIDTSFNSTVGANSFGIYQVACQPDGKVLIAGSFSAYNGTTAGNFARLNADGSLDTTFVCSPGANLLARGMALQPDGKVLLVGSFSTINGTAAGKLARLNTDGSVDTSFHTGTGPLSVQPNVIALHPNRKIIIGGGFTTYNGIASRRLAVLDMDGALDTTFAIGAGFSGSGSVSALYCAADGKVIAGGLFTGFNGTSAGNIVRLNNTNPLPVSLIAFNAQRKQDAVQLTWLTASELNNAGFEVLRKTKDAWQTIGFVQGKGNSTVQTLYTFTDHELFRDVVYYRLQQIDADGRRSWSDVVAVKQKETPVSVSPNPFGEQIVLNTTADIELYDLHGTLVLKANNVSAIDTRNVQPGAYVLRVVEGAGMNMYKVVK